MKITRLCVGGALNGRTVTFDRGRDPIQYRVEGPADPRLYTYRLQRYGFFGEPLELLVSDDLRPDSWEVSQRLLEELRKLAMPDQPGTIVAQDPPVVEHSRAQLAGEVGFHRLAWLRAYRRAKALAAGPVDGDYQPYAVDVDGEVKLAVLLDDLRAALEVDQ